MTLQLSRELAREAWPTSPARAPRLRTPRRLAARSDYPRNADALGSPVLEASRVVPLPRSFPRRRSVSCGRSHEWLGWTTRTAAQRAVQESATRRLTLDWPA